MPVVLAVCVLALSIIRSVAALQATPETTVDATPGAATPAVDTAATPETAVTTDPIYTGSQLTFAEFGYDDLTAQSSQTMLEYFLPVPAGAAPTDYTGLVLIVSHSSLLLPELSTMTVVANGETLTSVVLDDSNQNIASLEIELPTDSFTGTGYLVQIRFSLRITENSCEDDDNQALWATIHKESTINVTSVTDAANPDLLEARDRFSDSEDPTTIVLPRNPSSEALDAAGKVAFETGRWSGAVATMPTIAYADIASAPGEGPRILVGTATELGDIGAWIGITWNGSAFTTGDGPVPEGYGVIALRYDPDPVLLVSGATPEGLSRAVEALTTENMHTLFAGPYLIVTGQDIATQPEEAAWNDDSSSFAQLGFQDRDLRGDGTHTIDLTFQRPPDWVAGNGGDLTLSMEASPAIRPELSWVSVSVNGRDIGSVRLSASASPELYRFTLPAAAVNMIPAGEPGGTLQVRIRLHLQVTTDACQQVDPQNAWATLSADSSWIIPHARYDGLDLARFPAPFAVSGNDAPLLIVLPDAADAESIAAGLQIAALLGQRTVWQQTSPPTLAVAGTITADRLAGAGIISIGGPDVNSVSAGIPESEPAAEPPALVLQIDEAERVVFRLSISPWSEDRAVLIIEPASSTGIASITSIVTDDAILSGLSGESASIVPGLLPQSSSVSEAAIPPSDATPELDDAPIGTVAPTETPTVTSQQTPGESGDTSLPMTNAAAERAEDDDADNGSLNAWQVIGAILFGGFLAAIILFLWNRFGNRWTSKP